MIARDIRICRICRFTSTRCSLSARLRAASLRPVLRLKGSLFFAQNELPELSVGRVVDYQIARMYAHAESPGLPTDFD